MVVAPNYSFIQFTNPDDCCCGVVLPAATVSDVSFYVYTDFRFKVGVKSETTGNITLDSFIYQDFGDWVDLIIDNGNDLSDVFQCNECFRIIIADENDTILAESNLLQYICDTSYSSVIKYYLNEAGFGWDCPTGWNSIRLPIYLSNPQFPQEQEVYKRRNGSHKILFVEISKEYALLVDYLPENIHHKLVVALSHDEVYIDDILLTKSDDYSIDWESVKADDCGRYAPAACNMIENITANNSNCGDCNNARKYCTVEWVDFICQILIEGDFIPISTPQELVGIMDIHNPDNLPYVLTNDLDFTGYINAEGNSQWVPIQSFNGKFYGQGYTLKNFNINLKDDSIAGIFGTFNGHMQDVNLDNININIVNHSGTGGLMGQLSTYASVENCHIKNSTINGGSVSYSSTGGLIGRCLGKIKYCSAINTHVTGYWCVGVLCGETAANVVETMYVSDCSAQGSAKTHPGSSYVGGISGRLVLRDATIDRCIANVVLALVYNSADSVGGIAMQYHLNSSGTKVLNSVVTGGSITSFGTKYIGRISSYSSAHTIQNCYASNNFTIAKPVVSSSSGADGETVNDTQLKSQSFYEGLGYDFDGSTQTDGQPVWAMDDDGYPTIVKPYKKFTTGSNTGNALAQSLIYRMYRGNIVVFEETKSILTDVEPELTSEEYSLLTNNEVELHALALLATINKCADFSEINNVISEQDKNCTGEYEDEYMIGQIIDFAGQNGKWDVDKWLLCDGRTLAIADYPELFDIIGTLYGGDGVTTFKLPSHNGRVAIGTGQATDLVAGSNPDYTIGDKGGENNHKLIPAEQGNIEFRTSRGQADDTQDGQGLHQLEINGTVLNHAKQANGSWSSHGAWGPMETAPLKNSADSHENRQPFIVIHKLIRYKQ